MGFRRKQVAVMTLVAGAVALATSLINAAVLARVKVAETRTVGEQLASTLYHQASRAIEASWPDDLRTSLGSDPALRTLAEAVIGYSPVTLYAAISDLEGTVLFHSDPRQHGRSLPPAEPLRQFSAHNGLYQLWRLAWDPRTLAVDLPFSVDGKNPFGTVRVAFSPVLLRKELARMVATNTALAAGVVLAVFLASFYLADRLLAPFEVLRQALKQIDPDRSGAPLDLRDEADVTRVAEFFDAVGRRLARDHDGSLPETAWLEATLGGLSDAVIVLDREERIRFFNEPARRLLGQAEHERLLGRRLHKVLDPDHPLLGVLRRAAKKGTGAEPTTKALETAEGQAVDHVLSAQILEDRDGVSGFMLTARDVGKLAQLASNLSYSQKLTALGRLTSNIAHEIRNPLNAMAINVDLLRRKMTDSDPEAHHHVEVLDHEIRRLDRVIEGFLKFARPEETHPESVRLDELLAEIGESIAPAAERGNVDLDLRIEPDLPPLYGSRDLLRQAFFNIMANACQAMPSGGRLHVSAKNGKEGSVTVTIRDTGVGIPPDDLPRVFDLYYTTKEDGSGIGLSLVYRIVQLHGGEIDVDSEVGVGTVFTISLPEAPR